MRPSRTELLRGTLDLLVLRTLELQPLHGAGITERIDQTTRGAFDVKAGSLFPGGMDQVKERVREGRIGGSLETLGRDVRYAVRLMVRAPGFSAVVVLTLALTIAANATVFSVIRSVVLPLVRGMRA